MINYKTRIRQKTEDLERVKEICQKNNQSELTEIILGL